MGDEDNGGRGVRFGSGVGGVKVGVTVGESEESGVMFVIGVMLVSGVSGVSGVGGFGVSV